ncbi:exo-alpha-sialidase [Streptomyces sp. NPDC005892]|uniref:exo-alpha-sialidase n=1 Tax=Streptomyces sp. NPDC005892 TaxID=3155593 RepID=UPI0033D6447E
MFALFMPRPVRRPWALTVPTLLALVTAIAAVLVVPVRASAVSPDSMASSAVSGQSAVVDQDCTSSRIRITLVNETSAATTFTAIWAGVGTYTRTVSAGDRTNLYFTKDDGTAYAFVVTTPEGLNTSLNGTLDCGTALGAQISMECPRNADGSLPPTHRLRLTLVNRSAASRVFTVGWPGRAMSPWTATVPAHSSDASMYWTVDNGTPYTLTTTATGFARTESGKATCGLAAGTPGMNSQTLFSVTDPIDGVNTRRADGGYEEKSRTVASVRIPAMAVSNTGTIVAMADARVSGAADLGGSGNDIQVAMRRSSDGGATWTRAEIVQHAATTTEGYGDVSLLVDRSVGASGKIYAFLNYSPAPGIGYYGSSAGSNSATDATAMHIRYITSTDQGATWSTPVDVNPQVKKVSWAGMFASSGHGIQLADGRLVQSIVYRENGVDHAADIYSDDHGATWRAGAPAATGVNESKVLQRGSGKVVQNMRSNSGGNRWYATASDIGASDVASAFGTPWNSGLIDPGCNADEISYLSPTDVNAGGYPATTDVSLYSGNASAAGRNELTVRVSEDDGASWQHEVLIKPGAAGYSTMAVLKGGTVGNLYEIGSTGGIVFTGFSLAWATQ